MYHYWSSRQVCWPLYDYGSHIKSGYQNIFGEGMNKDTSTICPTHLRCQKVPPFLQKMFGEGEVWYCFGFLQLLVLSFLLLLHFLYLTIDCLLLVTGFSINKECVNIKLKIKWLSFKDTYFSSSPSFSLICDISLSNSSSNFFLFGGRTL